MTRLNGKTEDHEIACEDCGQKDWQDWTLLPHELFNETCPNGKGYLCLDCFCLRRSESQISQKIIEELENIPKIKLDAPFKHMSGRYRENSRFVAVYVKDRIAEIKGQLEKGSSSEVI